MDWKSILLNKEVITALLSIISLVALKYLGIPEDIWTGVFALLTVIVAKMFADNLALNIGRSIARGLREGLQDKE
jgi:hypothetical protein